MAVIRVAIIGIITVIIGQYMKNIKSDAGMLSVVFVSILLFIFIVDKLMGLIDVFLGFDDYLNTQAQSFIGIMLKMTGISYISEISAGICKDAGYNSIGSSIIIFSKISIMMLGTSVITYIIKLVNTYVV